MRSTLDEVLMTLSDLETYVKSINPVNKVLADITDPIVSGYLTLRRRLDYAAFIVALYAAFEKFVEDLVWSHTEMETGAVAYQDLPDELRRKHLVQSASLLTKGQLGEGRYADLTRADAITSLHQCESGLHPYKLNRHAVLYHENNLRPDTVTGLFSLTGVSDIHELARHAAPLVQWNCKVQGLDAANGEPVPLTLIALRLQDIVGRRNQVAHNGGDPGDVLGVNEMEEHLGFVRAYCRSLYMALAGSYYIRKPDISVPLGKFLEGPLQKNRVVVVARPSCRVERGQPVVGEIEGLVKRWGRVERIQIDNVDVPFVEDDDPTKTIGLEMSFAVTRRTKLYLLQSRDYVTWLDG
jgi:hypothetical protein